MPISHDLSAAGGSFLSVAPDRVFSVEDFAGDDLLMIQVAEQFSRNEVVPLADRLDAQEEGLMPELIRKAGQLGLTGVDAPDEYGGLGLSRNLAARILEFMSLNGSFSVTFGVTTGIGQVGLSLFGTDEQKRRYLPAIVGGEKIAAYCLSEPNSGSDALSLAARATRRGEKWILDGTKMWISNAKWAEFFLVMAKIDGEQLSAFLIERGFPGVSISREEHKMGLKGSSTARVILESAEAPLDNLLHVPGKGHQVAFNALNLGRFKLSSMSLGPARDSIGLAARYATERKQFGQSIARFGLIQKKFAEMAARFYVAESATYRTGALIDEAFAAWGGTPEGNRRAAEEFALECSCCKVLASEAETFIVDEALQCYGGYGFTEEFPIARHYRDARVGRIYEGTNEINRIAVASRLSRKLRDGEVRLDPLACGYSGELLSRVGPVDPEDQIRGGAVADLAILAYAEQSMELRARQTGGLNEALAALGRRWLHGQAAVAFQIATGEAITLPASDPVDYAALAEAVYERSGPLS